MKAFYTALSTLTLFATAAFGQINCPPNLPLTLVGNTEYCIGTSGSELSIQQNYDGYEWLPTTETTQNVLLTAGNYQVVVTHYTGCTDTLAFEVQQVSNPPQPTVTANGPTEFCLGESVTLSGPEGYPYYEWNSGSVSESITVYENGTFVLSIEDWLGCVSSSNSITVIVNPLPVAMFSPDVNGYDVEFNNLSTNATSYEWSFGDGATSTDFEPSHGYTLDGAVDMYLVATNDCGNDTSFLNLASVSIQDVEPFDHLKLFPVPTTGQLNYQLSEQCIDNDLAIHVYETTGRLVLTFTESSFVANRTGRLDLASLVAGTYLVQFQSGKNKTIRKVQLVR